MPVVLICPHKLDWSRFYRFTSLCIVQGCGKLVGRRAIRLLLRLYLVIEQRAGISTRHVRQLGKVVSESVCGSNLAANCLQKQKAANHKGGSIIQKHKMILLRQVAWHCCDRAICLPYNVNGAALYLQYLGWVYKRPIVVNDQYRTSVHINDCVYSDMGLTCD